MRPTVDEAVPASAGGSRSVPGTGPMTGTRPPPRAPGPSDRAQSVFDYSIGISLFVVVVLGVVVFVPTAFASFGGSGTGASDGLVAQRGADHLTEVLLDGPEEDASFSTGCMLLFFNRGSAPSVVDISPSDCGFESSDPLSTRLGFETTQPANVTVEADLDSDGNREILCWDGDDSPPPPSDSEKDRLVAVDSNDCRSALSTEDDVRLSRGSSAAKNGDFAAAVRYGRFKNTDVYVVVRVW